MDCSGIRASGVGSSFGDAWRHRTCGAQRRGFLVLLGEDGRVQGGSTELGFAEGKMEVGCVGRAWKNCRLILIAVADKSE